MTFDPQATIDTIITHAKKLGIFERVHPYEPKGAPGNGVSLAVWVDRILPLKSSGLDSTTVRVSYSLRIYQNMLKEAQEKIDTTLLSAATKLMVAYSGDFTFGGNARQVDLLGAYGIPLSAQAGYLSMGGTADFRTLVITLPIIYNDAFEQVA